MSHSFFSATFRLTFPYLVVLILLHISMKHFHDHGMLEIPSEDHVTCADSMWKNILYIDTFSPMRLRVIKKFRFCFIKYIFLILQNLVHDLVLVHFVGITVLCAGQPDFDVGQKSSTLCGRHLYIVFHQFHRHHNYNSFQ